MRIWQIFCRPLKIGILMGSFNPTLKKYELKIHRGIIYLDNEGLRKIWRGTDFSCQSWHEEFDKFWPEHLKVSKSFTLIGSFWAKYILFELKKYRGVIFHKTEEGYKIWRGIDLSFQNWHKEFDKFWPEHLRVTKIFHFNRLLLRKVYIIWTKKNTEELSFMRLERDTKFGEESNCRFKIDIRNLTNFDLSTQKSQRFSL